MLSQKNLFSPLDFVIHVIYHTMLCYIRICYTTYVYEISQHASLLNKKEKVWGPSQE